MVESQMNYTVLCKYCMNLKFWVVDVYSVIYVYSVYIALALLPEDKETPSACGLQYK